MKNRSLFLPSLLAIFALLTPLNAALDPTKDKILYMVADAHLDDQWNWTIQDTINSYIPKTLQANFAFFEKYPHYTFSFEETLRYRLIKEYYPADYLTLSNYVAQGRWRVTGSSVVAGDVNVPSPEALMRQILYGNGLWKKEFGKTSTDIFLPDCFGFGYALPSVAAHCGLKGFSSQKLSWGSSVSIPFQNVGRWIGPDGNSLIAVLQPGGYGSSISTNMANDASELTRMTNNFGQTGLYIDYRYFGTGDTGGGPDDASVNWLEQSVTTTNGAITVLSAGADQLYRDLTPAQIAMLPTYRGELLMKTHGTGCYTSHPEMKKYNRQNELRADAAERLSVIADWLQGGGTYPQEKFQTAWERFLWHQFHDDLTGTSIPEAYTFSWNDELLSLNEFGSIETHSAGILAQALDTTAVGVPLVVYNSLSVSREDIVEAVVKFTNGAPVAVRVFDPNGVEVPSQVSATTSNSLTVAFLANVPANGAAVFDVRPSATPSTLGTGLTVSSSQIENARYRVQLNTSGDVTSIFDKSNNRELLKSPIRWGFFYDASVDWPAWEIPYSITTASPLSYLGGTPTIAISENGPARVSLAVTRFNGGSAFTERLRLAAGGAGDRLEWDVAVNWDTPQTLLKVIFPLSVTNNLATYDLGLGTVQRGNATSSLYEGPAQQWTDLTSTNGGYGVTLMSDCKYGWDKPDNHTMRLTILHTPAVGGSYVYAATNGFGTHQFSFAVMGHTNDWRSGQSPWAAARLNQPLQAFQTVSQAGPLGKNFGLLSCNNSNVMVKAIKKAENSAEIIVRLQELAGQSQTAQLSFASTITAARQVTGAEDPIGSLSPVGNKLTVSLSSNQPVSLAITLAGPGSLVNKPVSTAITLPYNLDAISTDANRTDGNFDSGYTYPAELLPASIVREGITFQLGPTNNGAKNALSCQGQTISLPAGYDHLYILAAAASNDTSAPFMINSQATNLSVGYFSGNIGQWNPPLFKDDEIGWVCTHRHNSSGANEAYKFCYLFKYCFDLPAGSSTTLTLPNSPNIRIFAMSVAKNTTANTFAAGGPLKQNQLPWANAGQDRRINANAGDLANFVLDGSGSVDPDGTIVSYSWTQNGVLLASGVRPTVNLPVGTNVIVLNVTDDQGGTGQATVTYIVQPPLFVSVTATPTNSTSAPLTVQFTGQVNGGNLAPYDTTDDQTGTVTAQGQNPPNETASKVFDNSASTKWLDFANANPSTRSSWIQYQYANSGQYVVTSYTLTSANDAQERDPANWQLLGSNDGGSTWTTLDVRTNQVFSARGMKLSFSTTNSAAYNVYRLQIDSVYNPAVANSVQLAELELIGTPSYIFSWSFGEGGTSNAQNPQYTFTQNGNYKVVLGVSCGIQTGTNTAIISIGSQLKATVNATPTNGAAPLSIQFSALGSGGNVARPLYDTTDDRRGIVTAQGENSPGETAANAFDNTTSTKWLDFANANSSTRSSWIQYQYDGGLQYLVTQYTVSSANDATAYTNRNPANWRLLASNDGGISWTTLDVRTNQAFTANYQTRNFSFANANAYNIYRFQIDSVANPATANCMQLSELEFIGRPVYKYLWSFGDGTTSTAQNPQHTYATNGTYAITLVVSDDVVSTTYNLTANVMPQPNLALAGKWMNWPDYASNYRLYATTNLTDPIIWSPVTNANIINQGGSNLLELPISTDSRFFQLRSP